jgi:RNA polymerase subunit RPABC4/transcription elongation factor Spt4
MKLNKAKLCLDCEEIYEGQVCPKCGSFMYHWLVKWLGTITEPCSVQPLAAEA